MRKLIKTIILQWLLLLLFLTSGCSYLLVKTTRRIQPDMKPLPALTATKGELIERYNSVAQVTPTMKMKVTLKLVSLDKKSPTPDRELEYYITDAYIRIKRPDLFRFIGLLYKITAFDMVSNEKEFSVFVPKKNKIFHGLTNVKVGKVQDFSINIQPQHVFQAIAMTPLNGFVEKDILMETEMEARKSYYVLYIMRNSKDGACEFGRKIWIDRLDLNVVRQKIFGEGNELESDITYSDFMPIAGKPYPRSIAIQRPQDNFSLLIHVNEVEANAPLEDKLFQLTKPEGVEQVELSAAEEKK
jgi:outer membrane lipoprotein-sorting protein